MTCPIISLEVPSGTIYRHIICMKIGGEVEFLYVRESFLPFGVCSVREDQQ